MQFYSATVIAAAEFRDPLLPLWAMELLASGFLWVWLFCMGATVGSFLNVVVWRLPRGLNLAYPGSFCPHCGHAIRLQDNIPLLSWLNLRARCRDCGGPISPRYFVVELTVAVMFLVVVATEYYLPAGAIGFRTRHMLHVRDGVPFWSMYFLHVALMTTVIGAVLLRGDGNRVPGTLFLPVMVVGFVLPLIWPEVRSLPAIGNLELSRLQSGLVDGLAGFGGGLVAAAVLLLFARSRSWGPAAVIGFCCAIGVVLGWQRGMIVAAMGWPACEAIAVMLSKVPAQRKANGELVRDALTSSENSTGQTPVTPNTEFLGERDLTSNAGHSGPD